MSENGDEGSITMDWPLFSLFLRMKPVRDMARESVREFFETGAAAEMVGQHHDFVFLEEDLSSQVTEYLGSLLSEEEHLQAYFAAMFHACQEIARHPLFEKHRAVPCWYTLPPDVRRKLREASRGLTPWLSHDRLDRVLREATNPNY